MKARVWLLVSQAFRFEFSWDDLENYLCTKKSVLIKEIHQYFKDQKDADDRSKTIISQIEKNSQNNRNGAVFVR